ncbi:hypothetical protein C8R45DRAFT_992036 [Mycena sanguinolenta]|nr:hypothetical protein C8R45DRAFT_992036 [Mycena sanguinolenta]
MSATSHSTHSPETATAADLRYSESSDTSPWMDIPLLSNPAFCGTPRWLGDGLGPMSLVTLKSLLSDRALTVKRPRQQPPSLIFSLPAEMLAEIFLQATADDQSPSSMLAPMDSHFVLTQVCALWRAVAIHTPSLWSRIVLHLGRRTTGFHKVKILAKTCFERSCELPLALIITSSVIDSSAIPNLSMDLVLPVRHRIRHLELKLPIIFTESIFKLPRNSLKALRSITICALISDGDDGSWWFRSMSALDGAPLLESVKLSCERDPNSITQWRMTEARFDPYVAGLPWDRLTELVIQDLEIRHEDALYALELTTSLLRCRLDLRIIPPLAPVVAFTTAAGLPPPSPPPPPPTLKPVTVPALHTLELAVSGANNAPADFFDRLILPCLKELSIVYKDRKPLPCATLTALQTRSSFSLHRLALASRSGDGLLPFFESNPLLSRLQLAFCGLQLVPLANALTRKPEGSPFLPRLRLLSLADRWTEETPAGTWALATKAVIEMVRSRRRVQQGGGGSSAQLEVFTFGSGAALSAKKAARLNGWRAEGMRVRTASIPPERAHLTRSDYINRILWQDLDEL